MNGSGGSATRTESRAIRDIARTQIKAHAFKDRRCRAVERLVQKTLDTPTRVSLKEAANAARYSPQHFSEFFRNRVGLGFGTWQFFIRMQHVESLLVTKPWMPVETLADWNGYSDVSAFSRAFRRYAGISCRQFRWLVRMLPGLAESLPAVHRLDFAYALVRLAQQDPQIVSSLPRLARYLGSAHNPA